MHELGLTQLPMLSTDNVGKNFSREVERIFFLSTIVVAGWERPRGFTPKLINPCGRLPVLCIEKEL